MFEDDDDRRRFLGIVTDAAERFEMRSYAFCLMTNHYHLVCMTPRGNLSRAMRHINGVNTQASNRRHGRTGHLLEGRFRSLVVETEAYLRQLARYVAPNPVRAALVSDPAAWVWSSYRATAGLEPPPPFLDISWIDWAFGGSREEAQLKYRLFVDDALTEAADIDTDALALGTPAFEQVLRNVVHADRSDIRLPRAHRAFGRPALRDLFGIPGQSSVTRDRRIREAYVLYGYTLAKIASSLAFTPIRPASSSDVSRRGGGSGLNTQQAKVLSVET